MDSEEVLEGLTPEGVLETTNSWERGAVDEQTLESDQAPDIASSTEDYAARFSGPVGHFLLSVQNKTILDLVTNAASKKVLDVGGGHAQLAPMISQHVRDYSVTGSSEQCSQLLSELIEDKKIKFNKGSLLDLPHRDNQFDTVLSIRMLAHLKEWQQFIDELCRVSSNTVIVEYPEYLSCNLVGRPFFALKKAIEKNTRPYRLFSQSEIIEEFERNGFELVEVKKQLTLPLALHRIFGILTGKAELSRFLESIAQSFGLTRLIGSPVVLSFRKKKLNAQLPSRG